MIRTPAVPMLSVAQMRHLQPHFLRSRGLYRIDDRWVVSGIVYVIRYGLQWKDAPPLTGCTRPSKTASSAGAAGVLERIFAALAAQPGMPEQLMIDSTHLKAHRTAASLAKKRHLRGALVAPERPEPQAARGLG
jgi:putative transposase